jgi:hypothetical protein
MSKELPLRWLAQIRYEILGIVMALEAPLAEKLGVSRQTVNAIGTGKYDPSPISF